MTTFNDIFKSSFLNNITAVSIPDMLLTLILAFVLGLFIFFVYKKSYAGVMYSSSFGVVLISLCMITSMAILAVTSNVVLSLGMVGALSIVRFRTAVKEPMDLVFLFWSIAGGIVLAAGMLPLALIGSVLIGLCLILMANRKSHVHPYILVLNCADSAAEENATAEIKSACAKCVLKSKAVKPGSILVDFEVRLASDNTDFVNKIKTIYGVNNVTLVSYNGDYMG